MKKFDYKKELKHLYNPSSKEAVIVDVPALSYLMIDGSGNPNTTQSYKEAVEALYAVSYTLKFSIKKTREIDYVVMPLEGLWWSDDMNTFTTRNKDAWYWTM